MESKIILYNSLGEYLTNINGLQSIIKSYYILKERNKDKASTTNGFFIIGYFSVKIHNLITLDIIIFYHDLENLNSYLNFLNNTVCDIFGRFNTDYEIVFTKNSKTIEEAVLLYGYTFYLDEESRTNQMDSLKEYFDYYQISMKKRYET